MCDIPLDLQRRFEQRWAARFYRPSPPTMPKHQLEREDLDRLLAKPTVLISEPLNGTEEINTPAWQVEEAHRPVSDNNRVVRSPALSRIDVQASAGDHAEQGNDRRDSRDRPA